MSDNPDGSPAENEVPIIVVTEIRTDNLDLVRRAGKRSLQATVWWCLASLPCLFAGWLIGVAILCGAIFQLISTLRWLPKTSVLSDQEHTRWSIWPGLLMVFVAIIHVLNIALVSGRFGGVR